MAAVLLLGPAFLLRGAIFGRGALYQRDVHLYWHAQAEAFVRALGAGSWPVWDRTVAFGQPLLANSSAQVLYPFTWLNLLVRPWWYYTVFVIAHLVLTSAGAYLAARRLDCGRLGALTAAVLWMACGPLLSLTILWHHFAGAAWLPWVYVAAHDLGVERSSRSVIALAGAMAAQVLAGSFEMSTMGALTAGVVVLRHLSSPRPWSTAADRGLVVRAALACLLALGISAGQWMATAELALRSSRRALPRETRTYWSVHPLSAADVLLPGFSASVPLPAVRKPLFENREPFLPSLYLGLPSATLVAAALLDRRRRGRFFLAGGAAITLLFALGRHAPVYDLVVTLAPPLRAFRYPVKVMVLVALPWCLLAGMGVDALRREPGGDRRGALVAWLSAGVALAAAAGGVALASLGAAGGARNLAVAAALGLVAAGATVRRLRPGSARPAAAVIAIVAMADLLLYHRSLNALAPIELYTHRPAVLDHVAPGSRVYAYDYSVASPDTGPSVVKRRRLSRAPAGWPPEAALALADQMALAPVTASRWGLLGSFQVDYTGLSPYHAGQAAHLLRATEGTPAHLRLFQLGAVQHVVALHDEPFGDLRPAAVLPGLFEAPIRVFTVPDPMPHVFVAPRTRAGEGIPGLATLIDPEFDFRSEVLIPAGAPPGPAAATGTSRVVDARSDRLTLDVDTPAGGYVVVLESYDPGWRATIDGVPTPVVPANVLFRGILAPRGIHRVEMAYRPPGLVAGLVLSALSVVLLAVLGWRTRPARGGGGGGEALP